MPSLNFVMPHWLYWFGLVAFPLAAMYIVRRQEGSPTRAKVNLPTAYLFWLTCGFIGIHRFYLKNFWGIVYLPLFIGVLMGNAGLRDARLVLSNADYEVLSAEFLVERAGKDAGADGAAEALREAEEGLRAAREAAAEAAADHDGIGTINSTLAIVFAILLLGDAVLIPRMTRRCAEKEAAEGIGEKELLDLESYMPGTQKDPTLRVQTPMTGWIDRISGFTGEFVAYWSIIAVFIYYYEVVARYVFNSPTNWVHESMFLMFGMQYLIAGAFTLREDAHVRVDVLYVLLADRHKALLDVIASFFFFLFTGALLVTGAIFASDAIEVWEVSFTEWAIQYWPVKMSIVVGASLLILQGLSKLVKDVAILSAKEA